MPFPVNRFSLSFCVIFIIVFVSGDSSLFRSVTILVTAAVPLIAVIGGVSFLLGTPPPFPGAFFHQYAGMNDIALDTPVKPP